MGNPIWLSDVNNMERHAPLAQLVQSISFTPIGSEVRILQGAHPMCDTELGRYIWGYRIVAIAVDCKSIA